MKLDCPFSYYIVTFSSYYDTLSEKHKSLFVAEMLQSIPSSTEDEGKTKPRDLRAYKLQIHNFGINWQDSPDVPDLLNEDYQWKTL